MLVIAAGNVVLAQNLPDSTETVVACQRGDSLRRIQKFKKKIKRTGNIFYRFLKNFDDYDTTYITPNYYNWTTMLQNTNYFQTCKLAGRSQDGVSQSLATRPAPNIKVGPYLGWRWIFLGYTFDVRHPRTMGKSSEFNLSLYSSMLGCDFV